MRNLVGSKNSIFWRCTIANTIVYSVVFLLIATLFFTFVGLREWRVCERNIRNIEEELVKELENSRRYDSLLISLSHLNLPQNMAYRVIDETGLVLTESTALMLPPIYEKTGGGLFINRNEGGTTALEIQRWTDTADGPVLIQVGQDVSWFAEILENVLWGMFIILPIILLISLFVSYVTTRISFKPVREMSHRIREITAASLGETILLDVKDREMEELLDSYNAMNERLNRTFEDQRLFISNASHELKSPIATVKGYTSMLLRWGKDDKKLLEESLRIIDAETQRMSDIIQTLLSITRFESEERSFSYEWINLEKLFVRLKEEMRRSHRDIEIDMELRETLLWGQAKSVAQVLRILLANAVQYGEGAPISMRAYLWEDNWLAIEVEDRGLGMTEEDSLKIGQRFYRSETARTHYPDGLGLGLSMATKILQSHRGKLEVESEMARGTIMRTLWPRIPEEMVQ